MRILKTLNDILAVRSPESVERINGLAEALAHAIPMNMKRLCPSCNKDSIGSSLQDITPSKCKACGEMLVLMVDEFNDTLG